MLVYYTELISEILVKAYTTKTAEELMEIYTDGSPEDACLAFEELYHRYSNRVFIYCLKKLNIRSEAEDAVQKIFMKLHESKHLFDNKFKFEQWIFVISRTSVFDILRKRISDVRKIDALIRDYEVSLPDTEENSVEISEISNLDEDQRKLLELKYVDELSYKEISKILDRSEVSIRKTVSRLILKLKKDGVV